MISINVKKIISVILVVLLVFSVAFISAENKTNASSKPTLRVIVVTHPLTEDVTKMSYLKKIADNVGVNIKWEQYRANFYEKKQTVLASGDVPDIFISGWWATITDDDFVKYKGLYQPLNDLIPKYAPNVQKMFKEHPELKIMSTQLDGNIYSLPKYQRFWPKNMIRMMINKVWLDKFNLKVPTTWDELYNVLKAFKT